MIAIPNPYFVICKLYSTVDSLVTAPVAVVGSGSNMTVKT